MIILVNPLGDFPLNDDWAYAQSVKYFLDTGKFQLPGWAVANLLPQVFFGVLFCLPFGFSFTALRFSTLTMGLLGVIATYLLLKEISLNRRLAILGAFLIIFNPIYFGLSNTFMTDVPHYTVSVLSLYLFCVGLKKDSLKIIILSLVFGLIALLIRQVTGALLCGCAVTYIFKYKAQIQSWIKATLLFIFIPLAIQSIFSDIFWPKDFGHYGAKEEQFVSQLTSVHTEIVGHFIYFALCASLYLGFFLFPLLVVVFDFKFKQIKSRINKKIFLSSSIFLFTIIGLWLLSIDKQMPINGNVINKWGLGPLTLRDTLLSSAKEALPNSWEFFWILVTILSIIGAALLILFIALSAYQFFFDLEFTWLTRSQAMVNTSTAFIYFLPLGLSFFFDRYLLLFLPLLMSIILCFLGDINQFKIENKTFYLSLIAILIIGGFTIASTHDYLSWNRIRWQAINQVMQEKEIAPNYIDGGFEFNGWYLYNPEQNIYQKRKRKEVWWWVEQDNYVISFSPIEGYDVSKQYLLKNWLPFKTDKILVLEKKL
ncbi:MAG: glycosyltransferase family 39 protein [Xenococcaceae cyanobacterium MO_188.B19]|nr:glycosyltransferase family 39 protein [Xenococcaceae cyanobacterium MO_188.B19]